MRSPHRKAVSLLMLFTFIVMSFGAYGFNSKWLAHELDHNQLTHALLADHHPAPQLATPGNPDADPMSDAEHKLLHAYCHAEQFVNPVFTGIGEPSIQAPPSRPSLLTLRPSALESPFRPPRNTSLL
ncbi:MAG: hypothetical protein ACYCZT_03270 [Thiobacillus sp.]